MIWALGFAVLVVFPMWWLGVYLHHVRRTRQWWLDHLDEAKRGK